MNKYKYEIYNKSKYIIGVRYCLNADIAVQEVLSIFDGEHTFLNIEVL